ncbi:DUF695 domain-containing protein [Cellulophaga baltica]|uniref:DUF695 domain-containing protein n=1 Tax=Cellulophaga TaxID=104264 RepID=UPI001C074C91|nr:MULTISPECIES: DUF695 domain-containing protein [Cellulophaga]MBU2997801.1 DUF695 domain-containing protein [Cellulophaga baltica]MDO6769197.1 DUF695 domain-containing protein [Cellulophaga sp. 1_MG-2023]
MKKTFKFLLLILFSTTQMNAQNSEEQWDTYMAAYEDDKVGSTTLRMDLFDSTPIKEFEYVLVTGLTYETSKENGFPENETFSLLHKVGDELVEIVKKETDFILVGSFMYNKERLEYFYIKEPKNIISKIEDFYKKNYPDYKYYLNVKEDKEWTYYRDFLYPNEDTQNYMADQSVLQNLADAGDKLTKARRVDHWLYFSKESEMNQCENELIKSNFTVQNAGINKETNLPFELQIWRIDYVDIDSIYPITSNLRIIAQKYGGEYDGWETSVERE